MIDKFQRLGSLNASALVPRLWLLLLALAVPFFTVCTKYFEAWERTGTTGAFLSDMLLSATITGYIALLIILKTLRI